MGATRGCGVAVVARQISHDPGERRTDLRTDLVRCYAAGDPFFLLPCALAMELGGGCKGRRR
jgi:hypothetical protein